MCPPGVDQTERGSQDWHILVPAARQIYKLVPNNEDDTGSPITVLFNDTNDWNAWSKLVRRPMRKTRASKGNQAVRSVRTHSKATSTLELMPAEIIALIVRDIGLEKTDIIRFGLVSDILWQHVVRHIASQTITSSASWAGKEIACVGTYLIDLPASFEKDDLANATVGYTTGGEMCIARRINYAAMRSYEPAPLDPERQWTQVFDDEVSATTARDLQIYRCAREELRQAASQVPKYLLEETWILRNLTSKEYVRCRAGSGNRKGIVSHVSLPENKPLFLDDVLMMRLCWTLPPETDERNTGLARGTWAGHCFDIVHLGCGDEALLRQEKWSDVTEQVCVQAKELKKRLESCAYQDFQSYHWPLFG